MSVQQIQVLMERLSNLHSKFEQTNYFLTELDIQTIKNTIEQLNAEVITQSVSRKQVIPQDNKLTEPFLEEPFLDSEFEPVSYHEDLPKTESQQLDHPIDDVNKELDELFSPKVDEPLTNELRKQNFTLGINEQIMFARELFDNNSNELHNKIREFQEYSSMDLALQEFDNHFMPSLLNQGKDEEILSEFRALIKRLN